MKKLRVVFALAASLILLAAGCSKKELPREVPSSPKESYEQLPR